MGFNLGKMLKKGLKHLPQALEAFASGGIAGEAAYLGGEVVKEATGANKRSPKRGKKSKKGGVTQDAPGYVPASSGTPLGAVPTSTGPTDFGVGANAYNGFGAGSNAPDFRRQAPGPMMAAPAPSGSGMPSTTMLMIAGGIALVAIIAMRK